MATGATRQGGEFRLLGRVGLLSALLLGGCGKQTPTPDVQEASVTVPADPVPVEATASTVAVDDPRWNQPFADATLTEPPPEWHRPPDMTTTGKSIGKLYTDVVQHWNEIKFINPSGKRIGYRAVLDTDLGPIEITLRPDLAPNHVRSFVALCRAGYYDGLVFDRTVHEDIPDRPDTKLDLIEAGCPLGTGEAGYGSIGYWLKPEINPQATHEEGTVGASHGEEADVGACKFYINLGKAPFMDGNYTVFGKVTQGLSTARKILSLPVRNDAEYPEGDRPVKPVVIRKVLIEAEEVDR